jgi:hypothetical protein
LDAGLTPQPLDGCTIAGNAVTCAVGTVTPNATGSVTITADVGADLANGAVLTDVATVASRPPIPTRRTTRRRRRAPCSG